MDDGSNRRKGVRMAPETAEQPGERPDDQPARRRGARQARPPRGKKTKVCLSFDADFAVRLATVSAVRRLRVCDLVEELCWPYLRSWRMPSQAGASGGTSGPEEVSAA